MFRDKPSDLLLVIGMALMMVLVVYGNGLFSEKTAVYSVNTEAAETSYDEMGAWHGNGVCQTKGYRIPARYHKKIVYVRDWNGRVFCIMHFDRAAVEPSGWLVEKRKVALEIKGGLYVISEKYRKNL